MKGNVKKNPMQHPIKPTIVAIYPTTSISITLKVV
jgi:hypothetical protein